jgi:hypothetical protein
MPFLSALWRRLWSPCWLGHAPRVIDRDARGRLVLVCPQCRHARVVTLDAA